MEENLRQEIRRYKNGKIERIINYNNIGQKHGLTIRYETNGSIWYIDNWFNDKKFGLDTFKYNGCITQKYYL